MVLTLVLTVACARVSIASGVYACTLRCLRCYPNIAITVEGDSEARVHDPGPAHRLTFLLLDVKSLCIHVTQHMLKRSVLSAVISRAHVYVRCPSPRLRRHLLSKFPHGVVERVRDCVGVDRLLRQQLLIEPSGNIWAIDVHYRPGFFVSSFGRMRGTSSAYHFVATTLLKPANSIAAARWTP
jgi:hypothetical protein